MYTKKKSEIATQNTQITQNIEGNPENIINNNINNGGVNNLKKNTKLIDKILHFIKKEMMYMIKIQRK